LLRSPWSQWIGFGLAVAVLFDAFVVRLVFVPAVLAVLGDKVLWLPRRLDRILPHVDVEGEALSRLHAVGSPEYDEKTDTGTHSST
jgi:RND superfamily putative drug exporter